MSQCIECKRTPCVCHVENPHLPAEYAERISKTLSGREALVDVLNRTRRAHDEAIDRLLEHADKKVVEAAEELRLGVELLACLRRLVEGRSVRMAFGPPGDYGYETPLGEALARCYREGA